MRVLELFCGTKSIGKYCARNGIDVVSLDIDAKCEPTHVGDIREWDYKMYPPGHFDIVWSSPPCTHYSVLRTTGGPRDIEGANTIVKKTLEIIDYFAPKIWFMENPASGYLKHQPFMSSLPYVDVHYCMYGYPYRKWTRIWTNLQGFAPPLCKMDCAAMITDPVTGNMRHKGTFGGRNERSVSLKQRYSIPPGLVNDMFDFARRSIEQNSQEITYANNINTMPGGGHRVPIRIRSTNIDDPMVTNEYKSISEAANAIKDQVSQSNVRAVLTRCINKNKPLAGRIWSLVSDPLPSNDSSQQQQTTNNNDNKTSNMKESIEEIRIAELQLLTEETILKTKRVELLLAYLKHSPITQCEKEEQHNIICNWMKSCMA